MADSRDRSTLRQLVGDVVVRLGGANAHATLDEAFAELGMPPVSDEGTKNDEELQETCRAIVTRLA
ncbi:hypothetical protein [Streptomyces sp. NPDC048269]|uniref:hypothetical protein n=1 Tax=Streptomyces sp. NPDC048269 TaxID=3155753 RepID=UPI003415945B